MIYYDCNLLRVITPCMWAPQLCTVHNLCVLPVLPSFPRVPLYSVLIFKNFASILIVSIVLWLSSRIRVLLHVLRMYCNVQQLTDNRDFVYGTPLLLNNLLITAKQQNKKKFSIFGQPTRRNRPRITHGMSCVHEI